MKKFLMLMMLAVGMLAAVHGARAENAEQPKVIGVLFYADWCGSCKVLDPKIEALKPEFAQAPILFTRVDVTNEQTKRQSALFAEWTGLGALYREHSAKTGFMLLVDPATKTVLNKLVKMQSDEELRAAIAAALAGS